MSKSILAFSMSLDGFIAGPDISAERAMGAGGERLHQWLFSDSLDHGVDAEMAKEISARVGAVVLGKRTFDVGLRHWQDTPYPVPSFVLTHEARDKMAMKSADFIFVNDGIENAHRRATASAGGKDIIVMGAHVAQQFLRVGLLDEICIQLVPVLLGAGSRLFDNIGGAQIELENTRTVASPLVTHLRYRVLKLGSSI
jgi:dihydrofolate reductase